jgi:exosome complex component RRP4
VSKQTQTPLESSLTPCSQEIPPSSRTAISLVSNLINLFAAHNVPLSDTLLLDGHAWVHKRGVIGPDVPRDVGERLLAELVGVDVSADRAVARPT